MLPLLNIADYARAARAKLSKEVCDYIEGGALDEITLCENTTSWERLKLYYHVLAGVGTRDTRTTVLGQKISMPIAISPTAFLKLICAEGEIAAARAAKAAGTLFVLSSLSNTAMELMLAEAASPRWFQLDMYKDREITFELVTRAEAAAGDLCEIYVDGGIRRGSDVLKAIALGARAVLVGRPTLWGLCVAGEQGAVDVLEILRRELDEAMLLCGCTTLGDINRSLLAP